MVKISKKSWHYRFYILTSKENPPDNLIDYWSLIIWNLIVSVVISILGFIVLPYLMGAIIFEPIASNEQAENIYKSFFLTIFSGYLLIAFIIFLLVAYIRFEDWYSYRRKPKPKPKSPVVSKPKPEWSRIEFVGEE